MNSKIDFQAPRSEVDAQTAEETLGAFGIVMKVETLPVVIYYIYSFTCILSIIFVFCTSNAKQLQGQVIDSFNVFYIVG